MSDNTDLYQGAADSFAMLTKEELAKAMPLCADVSLAGSRDWTSQDRTPVEPAALAQAIDEWRATR